MQTLVTDLGIWGAINLMEGYLRTKMQEVIDKEGLPDVVFHSLRHTSITYKLKFGGGDIKAVRGDSGHAQVKMVTDVYSHIPDDDRRNNAQLFENAFYSGAGKDPAKAGPRATFRRPRPMQRRPKRRRPMQKCS